ncbi:MAG: O-methyltransferase [Lachnospiraceae bacterium]|nr:O-methyltransferase [Lachnospiraceae bacterium]
MIDERISEYLRSLERDMPEYLEQLEKRALREEVPIIRKDAQALLRFLLQMKRPKRILEVGTAVGFSCMYMSEYMPADAKIATIEKVQMRIVPAKENFAGAPRAERIALLIGDAAEVLRVLCEADEVKATGTEEGLREIYLPAGACSVWQQASFTEKYDFIFMDAAKGQYMNFLPYLLKLLAPDGLFVTDNVLQEGSIADSKFSITRRDRTIHMRMREYLYELTHNDALNTTVLPVGDGMALTTFKTN